MISAEPRHPKFVKDLSDTAGVEGEPLKLEAQVEAFPAPEMKWTKDGHPLRPSAHVVLSSTPSGLVTLAIEKAKPEDAGVYELIVSNRMGDATSAAKVIVKIRVREVKAACPSMLHQNEA